MESFNRADIFVSSVFYVIKYKVDFWMLVICIKIVEKLADI